VFPSHLEGGGDHDHRFDGRCVWESRHDVAEVEFIVGWHCHAPETIFDVIGSSGAEASAQMTRGRIFPSSDTEWTGADVSVVLSLTDGCSCSCGRKP
jgi:hypothetical protein